MRVPHMLFAALLVASSVGEARQPTRDPGAIVLLAESPAHDADAELTAALLDPDPTVRLVAARVISVGAHVEMLGAIVGALGREQDPDTGTELVRAALYLGGHRDLPLIEAQAKRLGRRAQLAKAEWQVRVQPSTFVPTLPDLIRESDDGVADLIALGVAQHPDMETSLFDEWMRLAPEESWGYLLELAYSEPAPLAPAAAILKRGLASSRPSVRQETVWFIVLALRDERKIPSEVLDAALPSAEAHTSDWESFGRELVARHYRKVRTADRSELIRTATARQAIVRALSSLTVLTKPEQDAVAALGLPRVGLGAWWRAKQTPMRTIDLPAAGVVGATMNAAGCKASGDMEGAALEYWPDGRPRNIKVGAGRLSASCVKALSALSRLSIAERGYPVTGASQVVVLPFHPAFFACSSRSDYEPARSRATGPGRISTPHKTRDVKPYYPEEARHQRIQGTVVLEATISRHGCIQSARVMRSIPSLDVPALWAITQWLFEPSLRDGTPVPVIMTVTVNFNLQ